MTETIVLLHGIFRTHRSLSGLAKYLRKAGYEVINVGYPSTKFPLETLADHIHEKIAPHAKTNKLHFAGYSMGGLLIRAYLKKYPPANLGRIVMIAVPNQGSEIADFVKNWRFYKKFYGPAGQQLTTDQSGFQHLLTEPETEIGIISGSRSLDPLGSWIIGKENDGKVSIESSKLANHTDHIVIKCDHTFFPNSRKMWKQTLTFMQQGKFNKT
jgi:pimeloyl-ACP methyl ester carboxylesterase